MDTIQTSGEKQALKNMNKKEEANTGAPKSLSAPHKAFANSLYTSSGKDIIDQILGHDSPRELVRHFPCEDFFWLIKKVGDESCLPMLELASEEQWQYLLDLEVWKKDRIGLDEASRWLSQLHQADPSRLAKWLLNEGRNFAHYFFIRKILIRIVDKDEEYEVQDELFTLDGVFYIKVIDGKQKEIIEKILRAIAMEDFDLYQALLVGIGGVLPDEVEEENYRLRNIRLAEHGFLPFEEALSIYSFLEPKAINVKTNTEMDEVFTDEKISKLVPAFPLNHIDGHSLLTDTLSRIVDERLLDRIRLEFAALCNQILTADSNIPGELEILIKACQKAAGYLNLALEKLCGEDISSAEKVLENNHIHHIFRVGFGQVLQLKWEIERRLRDSWFSRRDLGFSFWGDNWGGVLRGILSKRPLCYVGFEKGNEFRDFNKLSELESCRRLSKGLMYLDKVIGKLTELYPLEEGLLGESITSCHPLLFNFWARKQLDIKLCFSSVSLEEAKEFFRLLRIEDDKLPYRMVGFEHIFIEDFMAYARSLGLESDRELKHVLSVIWQEFREEFEWVSPDKLDRRFMRFIQIR